MSILINVKAFSDAELLEEIRKAKHRLSRGLKSESANGFSAAKEDFANIAAFLDALTTEALQRGIIDPAPTRRRRRFCVRGAFAC